MIIIFFVLTVSLFRFATTFCSAINETEPIFYHFSICECLLFMLATILCYFPFILMLVIMKNSIRNMGQLDKLFFVRSFICFVACTTRLRTKNNTWYHEVIFYLILTKKNCLIWYFIYIIWTLHHCFACLSRENVRQDWSKRLNDNERQWRRKKISWNKSEKKKRNWSENSH